MLFYCNICGKFSYWRINRKQINEPNHQLRESINCRRCGCTNRHRQLVEIICKSDNANKYSSLIEFSKKEKIFIYNTEADRPIHNVLKKMKNYVCSEYIDNKFSSGEIINGVMHQDLMATSFNDNCFDMVLTSDVLEHISDPWKAFKEIHRILKPGGRHIFTVPFFQRLSATQERAYLDDKGKIVHILEPMYHSDPLKNNDILVYNIFSIDFLGKLEIMGFRTLMYKLSNPIHGIYGPNAIVFESIKR